MSNLYGKYFHLSATLQTFYTNTTWVPERMQIKSVAVVEITLLDLAPQTPKQRVVFSLQ